MIAPVLFSFFLYFLRLLFVVAMPSTLRGANGPLVLSRRETCLFSNMFNKRNCTNDIVLIVMVARRALYNDREAGVGSCFDHEVYSS